MIIDDSGIAQGKPYSADELALLEEYIEGEKLTTKIVRELFPDRTPAGVRARLHKMRKERGTATKHAEQSVKIVHTTLAADDPGVACGWATKQRSRMAASNSAFLAALAAA